ncbi:MAG: hypothetical protein R3B72_51100 [Polyangiaceae bacterium]
MAQALPLRGVLASLLLALVACSPPRPVENPKFRDQVAKAQRVADARAQLAGPPGLPSVVIAELASPETEVHFARNGARGLLLSRRGGRWLTGPVDVDRPGDALPGEEPEMKDVAPAPGDRGPLALVPSGTGFLIAWSRPSQAGHELWVQRLDREGEAQGQARSSSKRYPSIVWVEAFARAKQSPVILWQVERGEASDLYVTRYAQGGLAEPQLVAEGVGAWHAAAGETGAGIGWVEKAGGEAHRGKAWFRALAGDNLSPPVALTAGPSALPDVQLAEVGGRYLAAWTDEGAADPHVLLARFDPAGALAGITHAVPPVGGQTLIALVEAEDHRQALLAWERSPVADGERRQLQLTSLDADGKRKARARLELFGDASAPHLVPDGPGFAALTMAPMRREGTSEAPIAPHFVRLGADLGVVAGEPIRIAPLATSGVQKPGVPAAVRGLDCQKGLCSLLAAGDGSPSLLALVTLPRRSSPWQAPGVRLGDVVPPEAEALTTLADVSAPVAEMDATRLADGRLLVAWVTHHTSPSGPAPAARPSPTASSPPTARRGRCRCSPSARFRSGGSTSLPCPRATRGWRCWAGRGPMARARRSMSPSSGRMAPRSGRRR